MKKHTFINQMKNDFENHKSVILEIDSNNIKGRYCGAEDQFFFSNDSIIIEGEETFFEFSIEPEDEPLQFLYDYDSLLNISNYTIVYGEENNVTISFLL